MGVLIPRLLYGYEGWSLVGIVSELHLLAIVFLASRYKSGFFTPSDKLHFEIHFEAIREMPPVEGVEYIVRYIRNPRWDVPRRHLESFLRHLAQRDDEYGQVAKQELQELGL